MNACWYCLQVAPQREFTAERLLLANGIRAFCPTETKLRRANRYCKRKISHVYPLMLRYVFAQLSSNPWHLAHLCRLRLITAIVVSQGGRPLAISDEEMDRVFLMSEAPQPHLRAPQPHRAFRVGDMVDIVGGGFAGHTVRVEDIEDGDALIILRMFGREQEVRMPLELLEVA